MKEQLVALLGEKVGLDESKASAAVDAILGFIKENPEKLQAFLGGAPAGSVTKSIGRMFGR